MLRIGGYRFPFGIQDRQFRYEINRSTSVTINGRLRGQFILCSKYFTFRSIIDCPNSDLEVEKLRGEIKKGVIDVVDERNRRYTVLVNSCRIRKIPKLYNTKYVGKYGRETNSPSFYRSTEAYDFDGKYLPSDLYRYVKGNFGYGILVEEGTTNYILSDFQNDFSLWNYSGHFDTGKKVFTPINELSTVWSVVEDAYIYLDVNNFVSSNEYTTASVYVFPSHDYTFTFFWNNKRVDIFCPSKKWTRLVNTQLYSSDLENPNCILITYRSLDGATRPPSGFEVAYCMPQLEKKRYATSFIGGEHYELNLYCMEDSRDCDFCIGCIGFKDEFLYSRSSDLFLIPIGSVFNPREGTIEIIFTPYNVPPSDAVLFQFGNYGNNDNLCVYYHINEIDLELRSANGESVLLVLPLSIEVMIGNPYYLAVRWLLPGYLRLDFYDYFHDKYYQAVLNTTLSPVFDGFSFAGVGCDSFGNRQANIIVEDLRYTDFCRNDYEIKNSFSRDGKLVLDEWTKYKLDLDTGFVAVMGGFTDQNAYEIVLEGMVVNGVD